MLFDGEPGLASVKTQKEIFQKCNQLKVYANASFKRNMAERAVKELKIRLSIKLDLEGTALLFLLLLLVPKITLFYVFVLQENLCPHGEHIYPQSLIRLTLHDPANEIVLTF